MEQLTSPQGTFSLARFPVRPKETLRAWDAADEFLLQHLAGCTNELIPDELISDKCATKDCQHFDRDGSLPLLILNDRFGGLSVPLHAYSPTVISDSYLAHQGIRHNLTLNQLSDNQITCLTSLQQPAQRIKTVLIKIPKSLALLEDQLYRLRAVIDGNTQVIAAGMAKAIHNSTLTLFEKVLGPTKTSKARKKARLIFCTPDATLLESSTQSPYPKRYQLENSDYQICNHANVFSREKLDIGTRFFLEHLPSSDQSQCIVDLGCGNGVVGLIAAQKNPQAELTFVDESFMAVASAKENFQTAYGERSAQFLATDCLAGVAPDGADLILNNPPFHQGNAVGDHIAWQMFNESKKVLKSGGELWVIGNRHLGYHVKLKRLFGNCETVASNNKFVILKSVK